MWTIYVFSFQCQFISLFFFFIVYQVCYVFGKLPFWPKITTWGILLQLKVDYMIISLKKKNKKKTFGTTHSASDHDVEADSESFVESPELCTVLRLEILCKPVFQREDGMQPLFEQQHVTEWVLHAESGIWIWTTGSCSLLRRRSWQTGRPVWWKSIWGHSSRRLCPGCTSTQR